VFSQLFEAQKKAGGKFSTLNVWIMGFIDADLSHRFAFLVFWE